MLKEIFFLCLMILCSFGQYNNYRQVYNLPEGTRCLSNGRNGNCINIHACQSAWVDLRRGISPYVCSSQGETPIVCCTNWLPNYNRKYATNHFEVGSSNVQSGSKARNYCRKYLETLNYQCRTPRSLDGRYPENNFNDYVAPLADAAESSPDILILNTETKRGYLVFSFWDWFYKYLDYHNQERVKPVKPVKPDVYPIATGTNAGRGQYPHMALIGYGNDIRSAQWLCGGSVISENYILTAAHCISSPQLGSITFIGLGVHRRSDPPGFWQVYKVKRIIPHPEYRSPSTYNDIALLETEKPIYFNFNVLPACLPLGPETGETAEATGWGALGHRSPLADTLQTVILQRFDEETCSRLYPKHRHFRQGYNHATQMCYGDKEIPKDTCQGDSGGPLQTENEFASCAFTIIGVTSNGIQCGVTAGSGIYTRVYPYVPWIESIVWP